MDNYFYFIPTISKNHAIGTACP